MPMRSEREAASSFAACRTPLEDVVYHGETLYGCARCNRWWPLAKPPIRLGAEDLIALRDKRKDLSLWDVGQLGDIRRDPARLL